LDRSAVAALLALLASAVWGTSDFAGGTLSRRIPSLAVVFLGIVLALGALLIGLPWARPPFGAYLGYGAAAGVLGALALVCFYRAMAAGPMSLVAPLSATGTVIPVLWALVRGESVGAVQAGGMALAFTGVLLACGPELRSRPHAARSTFLYTLVSAVGFGCYFVLFALGSRHSVYGTLLAQRAAGLLTLVPLALAGLRSGRGVLSGLRLGLGGAAMLLLVGLGDVAANGLYGLASRRAGAGLAVVTVLASLYPVATTLLARVIHGERLRAVQNVGVAAALGGVLLLNA
jgi:drug/metabolite transporter (DMT)-like permease